MFTQERVLISSKSARKLYIASSYLIERAGIVTVFNGTPVEQAFVHLKKSKVVAVPKNGDGMSYMTVVLPQDITPDEDGEALYGSIGYAPHSKPSLNIDIVGEGVPAKNYGVVVSFEEGEQLKQPITEKFGKLIHKDLMTILNTDDFEQFYQQDTN
jgi:hypothetical protein